MYSDRVSLSHITSNPSLGEKDEYFTIKACISGIKPDQKMWYRACNKCNKKVTQVTGSVYRCEECSESQNSCRLRYIMLVKVCDGSGDAYLNVFNQEAEKIIGCSADELNNIKSKDEDEYEIKLNEATWKTHFFRVKVSIHEHNNAKRQSIIVRAVDPIDSETETKFLQEDISKIKVSN